jgi:hypothetical protein
MLLLIILILVIVSLIIPRRKLDLKSKKLVNIQLVTLCCIIVVYLFNLFYNWHYFKEYDGPTTAYYLVAKYTECALRYSILVPILVVVYYVYIKKPIS